MTPALMQMAPTKGCVLHCRSHHHLVEEVFWEREVDARVLAPRALEPGATPRDDGSHGCHSAPPGDP